jgi:tetratricopeptide (TPR) repeat protein
MAAKIDKKELNEPDRLQLFFLSARAFVEKNKIRIYTGAGIFILIVVLTSSWYLYRINYESSAGKLFSRVLETAMKAGSPAGDEAAIKGYKDVIAQYPRSHAAITAQYKLGNLYFGRHDVDVAINAYQDFLKRAPADSDLVILAYNGLGSCHEAKKDFNKALEYFDKALKTNPASSFESLNYQSIARVYEEMNNQSKAAEFYRKALEKTKDPLMMLYLKRKISLLG